jgi:hypothetical protein
MKFNCDSDGGDEMGEIGDSSMGVGKCAIALFLCYQWVVAQFFWTAKAKPSHKSVAALLFLLWPLFVCPTGGGGKEGERKRFWPLLCPLGDFALT